MIDPKELRIGNLVTHVNGGVTPIHGIVDEEFVRYEYKDTIYDGNIELLDPIPITPEWLERLGFEKRYPNTSNEEYAIDVPNDYGGNIVGSNYNGEFKVRIEGCDGGRVGIFLDYVHQVQNAFFALTGQELTVKDTKFDALKESVKDHLLNVNLDDKLKVRDLRRNDDGSFTADFIKE